MSLRYGIAFHQRVCVTKIASVNSPPAVIRQTQWPPDCISSFNLRFRLVIASVRVSSFSVLLHIFSFEFVFYLHIYIYILLFTSGKKLASLVHADQLLHEESRLTTLQIRMVSKHKLCRPPRRTYRQLQAKMFSLWIQYENGDRTAKQLLRTDREIINNPTVERSY